LLCRLDELHQGFVRLRADHAALPDLLAGMPALERWADAMAARPAIQRATRV